MNDALCDSNEIDASQIQVEVSQGEVILTGSVPDRLMKKQAESCCESIRGVKEVSNSIRVSPRESSAKTSDSAELR